MVEIRVSDPELRHSLHDFLFFAIPGEISELDSGLRVTVGLEGSDTQTELRILERLVRAWRAKRKIDPSMIVQLMPGPDGAAESSLDHPTIRKQ